MIYYIILMFLSELFGESGREKHILSLLERENLVKLKN